MLLNRSQTAGIGTTLGMSHQPQIVSGQLLFLTRIRQGLRPELLNLLEPVPPVLARGRLMTLPRTVPAEEVALATVRRHRELADHIVLLVDMRHNHLLVDDLLVEGPRVFDGHAAAGRGTPPDIRILVDKRSDVEVKEALGRLAAHQLPNDVGRNDCVAVEARANNVRHVSLVDLHCEIQVPAGSTKLVAAVYSDESGAERIRVRVLTTDRAYWAFD